jgi:pimeloyl-ACP methyl ester carboxylesterase
MPRADVNGLEIEYDSFGDPDATPLLLVMGLAYQMIEWDDAFCTLIASRGFRVTRFDNRDCGLSWKLDSLGPPDVMGLITRTVPAPYSLDDMASDAIGVLDAIGVSAAHIVGASMGGMIAQLIAINHPERVLSLTSMMSTVGGPHVVQAEPAVSAMLIAPPGKTRDERVEQSFSSRGARPSAPWIAPTRPKAPSVSSRRSSRHRRGPPRSAGSPSRPSSSTGTTIRSCRQRMDARPRPRYRIRA